MLGAKVMSIPSWVLNPDQIRSSYLLLATLAGLVAAAAVLFQIGLAGWFLKTFSHAFREAIRKGFVIWERLLGWARWPQFLVVVFGFLVTGVVFGGDLPGLRTVCGLAPLIMGSVACLAYMFIDLERSEVERGHKAVHNPLKGQVLAHHLARYGHQVRVPLMISAICAMIAGFALFNQGLYETVGRGWYKVEGQDGKPIFADFLAYALTSLLGIVDVLDLAKSHHWLGAANVRQSAWPASTILVGFKSLFTLVLLQQLFSSLRQRKLMAETIIDFWSPHEPIHERARDSLPQYGASATGPLMVSLRAVQSLTKEQRDQLPLTLATIGPSTVPALLRHLHDSHEHVRAIAAAALGLLGVVETVPSLAELYQDPSDVVRQSAVEALGHASASVNAPRKTYGLSQGRVSRVRRAMRWVRRKKHDSPAPAAQMIGMAVATLESALSDSVVAVRIKAARALGQIGPPAASVTPALIGLLKDADETVRCEAAQALSRVVGEEGTTVAALIDLLQDDSAPVKASAAQALGALKRAAAHAVPALVPLLQDREESVRTAAAAAVAQFGPLDKFAISCLAEGLESPDNVIRARTAEALGTIGEAASEATPGLVEAMADDNDRVRAKAVMALGKIGESAAGAAVPGLVRALRDQDNWVSALAAEALGEMGESGDGTVTALVRSLGHLNARVRGNSAAALGKMGRVAAVARSALEITAADEDGEVRCQALRALGAIGAPTARSTQLVMDGLADADPLVRAAAVESLGNWDESSPAVLMALAPLMEDANDQVKVEVIKVLPRLAGASPEMVAALCRRLVEDDSPWVQVYSALALGRLGHAAVEAGGPLLRAVQIGEVSLREQAMRAIALIQPPEMAEAFVAGLKDACIDVRMVASAGWMNVAVVPEEAIPRLIEALRDPVTQVRSNAAHALGRLAALPAAAIPLLIGCTTDAYDGLRMNAAAALKRAPFGSVVEVMRHLVTDSNRRVALIAAGSLLSTEPDNSQACAVVVEALGDPIMRVRKATLELVESLGPGGSNFLDALKDRQTLEGESECRVTLARIIERLENLAGPVPEAVLVAH